MTAHVSHAPQELKGRPGCLTGLSILLALPGIPLLLAAVTILLRVIVKTTPAILQSWFTTQERSVFWYSLDMALLLILLFSGICLITFAIGLWQQKGWTRVAMILGAYILAGIELLHALWLIDRPFEKGFVKVAVIFAVELALIGLIILLVKAFKEWQKNGLSSRVWILGGGALVLALFGGLISGANTTHFPGASWLPIGGAAVVAFLIYWFSTYTDYFDSAEKIPWWMLGVGALALIFGYVVMIDPRYQGTLLSLLLGRSTANLLESSPITLWEMLFTGLPSMEKVAVEGILLTIRITLFAFSISIFLGLAAGLARISKNVLVQNIATFYVEVVRGIPLVVLMLYIAFVLLPIAINLLGSIGDSLNWAWLAGVSIRDVSYETRAIVALAFGYGAYEAEVFRAGIQSIERGQMEAARSLGMNYFQAMRYIILPQAIRRVLPPLGNDFIALLKDSALATVLAVPELTQLGRIERSSTFRVFEVFNSITILYLSMTLILSFAVRGLERRMSSDERTTSIR